MKRMLTTSAQKVLNAWRSIRTIGLYGGLLGTLCLTGQAGAQNHELQQFPAVDAVQPVAFYNNFLQDDGEEEEEELSLEERVEKLEGSYSDLGDDYEKLEKENKGLKKKLKTLAATGHGSATMKVNGRIHADAWHFPRSDAGINVIESGDPAISPQDSFQFRRLRFGVKGDLGETMLYKIEMEFAGGNDSEFRDSYLGWKDLPFLQTLLIGNQKRPYGLDHLNSSRYNVFLERPWIIESFNQDARRLGIQAYGISEDLNWNWRYGVFNQRLVQDEGEFRSDHLQLEFAGRMANTFWYDEASGGRGYAHWAVSGSHAQPDGSTNTSDGPPGRNINEARFRQRPEGRSVERWINTGRIVGADNYELLGIENVWNFGALQLVGEYQSVWLDRDAGTAGGDSQLNFDGAYFYASYFLTGEHMPWERKSGTLGRIKPHENFFLVDTPHDGVEGGWGAWQIAYRWSYADLNDDNIFGGRAISHTLGVNWYWNPYSRMQFNVVYGEVNDASISEGDSTRDLATGVTDPGDIQSGNFTLIGTRFMVDF